MKKKVGFLLILPACSMLLAGCDLASVKSKAKEIVKKIVYKLDDFFLEDSASASNVKVSYHL